MARFMYSETSGTSVFENKFQHENSTRLSPVPVANESPKLSRQTYDDLTTTEESGVPLNTPWTLWIDRSIPRATAREYEANLREIYTVTTVESFWGVYNHVPEPCSLMVRQSYHLMRKNVKPMWEDQANKNGGVWKLKCHKWATNTTWKTLLLACIGEQFTDVLDDADEIMGISVSVRQTEDLIQIWNSDCHRVNTVNVVAKLKEFMPDTAFPTIFYKAHQENSAYEGRR